MARAGRGERGRRHDARRSIPRSNACRCWSTGATGDRYAVACNGYPLPLAATGTSGEAAAGVRFRAWQPPQCLHPNIAPHVPLTFDVVDTWTGRSIGGCRYHVAHPGGRNFEVLPVNALEAEGRRRARFESIGHTAGGLADTAGRGVSADFPLTLDLRHVPSDAA